MSVYDDLPPITPEISKIWRGHFASTPLLVTDLVNVVLPDIPKEKPSDPVYVWKGCYWQPRVYKVPDGVKSGTAFEDEPLADYLFPKRDDKCLCVFDNQRRIWVVMWWPL